MLVAFTQNIIATFILHSNNPKEQLSNIEAISLQTENRGSKYLTYKI